MASAATGGSSRTRIVLAALTLLATLTLWLNQSTSGDAWGEARDRVWKTHTAGPLETARYPFVFLYRHSFDEALYFSVAGKILGKPYDPELLATARSHSGAFAGEDTPVDHAMHRPYAEVPLEYPALSLPFLLLPRLLTSTQESYAFAFSFLMGLCAFFAYVIVLRLFRGTGVPEGARGYLLASLLALAHGALFVQRLDAVLTLLLACAVHFWVRRRFGMFGVFLGLAAAFKLTPALLLLPLVAADQRILQHARIFSVSFVTALFGGLLPMFVFSRDALPSLLRYHGARGLHCESTWATLYGLLGGQGTAATLTYGSLNVDGLIPNLLAKIALPVTCVLLVVLAANLWLRDAKGDLVPQDSVRALLAACIIVWLTSKVFSPQYLTWGVPFILPCLYSKRDRTAGLLLTFALVITQVYLRGYYDAVSGMKMLGLVTLAIRDAALAIGAILLVRNFRSEAEETLEATSSEER